MSNVVFIPNIDLGNGRNKSYSYSINSWKHFCDLYDCELVVWESLLLPVEQITGANCSHQSRTIGEVKSPP